MAKKLTDAWIRIPEGPGFSFVRAAIKELYEVVNSLSGDRGGIAGVVRAFNGRTGSVTLASEDVTGALTYTPVNQAGDTMGGPLVLADDPTEALEAATKQYVDAVDTDDVAEGATNLYHTSTRADARVQAAAASDAPAALGVAAVGNGTTWARSNHVHAMPSAANVGAAPTVHGHAIADTTGLQAALDGKSATTHNHDATYAALTHAHSYLPLSGGTLTGRLIVSYATSNEGLQVNNGGAGYFLAGYDQAIGYGRIGSHSGGAYVDTRLAGGSFDIVTGGLKVGGIEIVTSGRNLVSIGTIANTGLVTHTSAVAAGGGPAVRFRRTTDATDQLFTVWESAASTNQAYIGLAANNTTQLWFGVANGNRGMLDNAGVLSLTGGVSIGALGSAAAVVDVNRTLFLRSYTVATLPSATTAAGQIYVSNEAGGAIPAFSDGVNWRRVSDRSIVS